jgi:DNA-binding NarL/FixJ family response regulator
MSILTKAKKEKLVLELHSLGKTYPEIAKEARISVRDIKPILVRAESPRVSRRP